MSGISRFRFRPGTEKRRRSSKKKGLDYSRLEQVREDLTFFIHEIRTPLTAIIASAEILKGHPSSAKERTFLLEAIEREGRRIDDLLKDFFATYQREETWLSTLDRAPVPPHELLQEAAERFRNLLPRFSIQIDSASVLPCVSVDRKKIELVLRNLVGNAVKYSPQGGTIVLSLRIKGTEAVFCVQDDGIGIPEESLERIFETTFRVDRPKVKEMPGAGLGLAIVRQIVESHAGRIWAENRPKGGSSFFFSLPLHPPG